MNQYHNQKNCHRKGCSYYSHVFFGLSILFLFFPLYSFSQVKETIPPITIEANTITVGQVFNIIRQEGNCTFWYKDEDIDLSRTVSIHLQNASLKEILKVLFPPSAAIDYQINGEHIILFRKKEINLASSYPYILQGKIEGAGKESLSGAIIYIKKTGETTSTDENGFFKLSIPDSTTLLNVSYLGYEAMEIPVKRRKNLAIVLTEKKSILDEIVVIGYGMQKKDQITGLVTKVGEDEFNRAILGNPLQYIQDRIPGLSISTPGGSDPNVLPSAQIRGVSTFIGLNEPLIIIDGIPATISTLSTISSEDISSISVLRDGSAAAIYGTRANNGVVIVSLKTQTENRFSAEYSFSGMREYMVKEPDILTAGEYLEYKKKTGNENLIDYGGRDDVYEALLKKSNFSYVHNLSVSGSSNVLNYRASVSYRSNDGIGVDTQRETLNTRLFLNQKAFDGKLDLSFNLFNSQVNTEYANYSAYYQAMKRNPTMPIYQADGSFFELYNSFDERNPVALEMQEKWTGELSHLLSGFSMVYQPVERFKTWISLALEKNDNYDNKYLSRDSYQSIMRGTNGEATKTYDTKKNRTLEWTNEYEQKIYKHYFKLLAGYSFQDFNTEGFYAANKDFITDLFQTNNLGAGKYLSQGKADMNSYKSSSRLISFFGRLNYHLDSRFLFNASIRREGSSKFQEGQQWGWFPSAGFGWVLSKEEFMRPLSSWMNFLKVRIGYGVTGSLPIEPYMSITKYGTSGGYWDATSQEWIPLSYGLLNNSTRLKWERNESVNIGLDFGLLTNRITGTLDVYTRTTSDLISMYNAQVPSEIHSKEITNVGVLRNKGVEVSLDGDIIRTRDFSYSANLAFSYEKNKVVSLSNDTYNSTFEDRHLLSEPGDLGYAQRLQEGQPVGSFYGYKCEGISSDGKWILKDLDGIEGLSEDDKTWIGCGLPAFKFSLVNYFRWNKFDFSFMLKGRFKYQILNEGRIYFGTSTNIDKSGLNVYRDALKTPLTEDPVYSSYFLEDGAYVKIDNVTLGYTLKLPETAFISDIRIFGNATNLFTFSKYSGFDPEINTNGLEPGIDSRSSYPYTKTFTIGLKIRF